MGQVLAICDYERQYVFRLAEFLNQHKLIPFEVVGFDDIKKLIIYRETCEIVMVVVGEALYEDACNLMSKEQLVVLVSDMTQVNVRADTPVIIKYQSANVIAKKLLEICCDGQGSFQFSNYQYQNTSLIGVYSPISRCLKTSFSIVLARQLSQKKKCLYINLEPYSGFGQLLPVGQAEGNIAQLLYYLEKNTDRFILKLKSIAESFGPLDYIPPTDNFLDLLDVSPQLWIRFLQTICEQTDYEVVILDLSDFIKGLFDILSCCNHIYTIVRKDAISMAKLHQYESLLSFTNHSQITEKTKKLHLPIYKQLPKELEDLPHSELAEFVKKLIKEDAL